MEKNCKSIAKQRDTVFKVRKRLDYSILENVPDLRLFVVNALEFFACFFSTLHICNQYVENNIFFLFGLPLVGMMFEVLSTKLIATKIINLFELFKISEKHVFHLKDRNIQTIPGSNNNMKINFQLVFVPSPAKINNKTLSSTK